MPSEDQLEAEITRARNDLEANLQELQLVVREKLDVRKHAREALDRTKAKLRAFVTRNVMFGAAAVAGLVGFWLSRRRLG